MRSEFIRIYKSLHTWTGIFTGLALFIAFYAGALTVFKEPLTRWVTPPGAHPPTVAMAAAPELIQRTLLAHPPAARGFELALEGDDAGRVSMSWVETAAGDAEHDALGGRHFSATLDAAGAAQVSEVAPSQLGEFIDILHRVVGLPFDNDGARWVMGVIACLYALALFSGVVVLMPTLVKDFFALRPGRNLKRMWLDAHNVVGIVSLPFHLLMAITAVVFAFHDGIYTLQNRLFHDGQIARAFTAQKAAAAPRDPAQLLPPARLLDTARALSAGFRPHSLQYAGLQGPRPMVRVWGQDPASLAPRAQGGFVALDPYTGKVLNSDFMPGLQQGGNLAIASMFALHMATFGGTPVKWMYFALGMAGAWLFYSGNLLWIESRRKKAKAGDAAAPVQRRDVRWLACATVGSCFGCMAGISLTIAAGKWLHGHVADLNAWHWYVYYAVFALSIVWAFARGPACAAVELISLAAAAALSIPLTSLAALVFPALGLWAHGAALGVDLTALGGAAALAWAARATARRVRSGPTDSVWSAASAHKA